MFVFDPDRECKYCGCTEYPFYMEIRGEKAIITNKCLLCYQEDDAQKSRGYYQRHKEQCQRSSAKRKKRNREKYNFLSRRSYANEGEHKRQLRKIRMADWYQKNKERLKKVKSPRGFVVPHKNHIWRQMDTQGALNHQRKGAAR